MRLNTFSNYWHCTLLTHWHCPALQNWNCKHCTSKMWQLDCFYSH